MNQTDPNMAAGGGQQGQQGTDPAVQPPVTEPAQPAAAPAPVAASQAATPAPAQPASAAPAPAAQTAAAPAIDLTTVKTKSGKGLNDFEVPAELIQKDPELIDLVLRSESMNDGERQYWFNLTEIMSETQVNKLRDILTRERKKLAEIEAKYGKPKVQLSPEEIAARNAEMEKRRQEQQRRLEEREQRYQAEESEKEAAILAELENL